MSFRLRIFLLVMLVATTAIGATAWLTLSLTSREVARADRALEQHERRITETINEYGVRHGRWTGVDRTVLELARTTGLHIQVVTVQGQRLADSDTLAGRPAGPLQSVPVTVSGLPTLHPAIARAMRVAYPEDSLLLPGADRAPTRRDLAPPPEFGSITHDLLGLGGTDPQLRSPLTQMVRQAAQYRAALVATRCIARMNSGAPAGLGTVDPPYLSAQQLDAYPNCAIGGTTQVTWDQEWLRYVWETVTRCLEPLQRETPPNCAESAFQEAAGNASAIVAVEIYLGAQTGADRLTELGQGAMFGAAGLIAVAFLGTAWIARRVSRPVHRLTMASFLLASGDLEVRVPTAGNDELAQLSASFNTMAEAVQRSEERQRRLIADVAHEMRTPLSNLRGYLEGLSDGVVEPSRELFASLHEETLLQGRILDDLQVLALAESGDLGYARAPLDLAELVAAACTAHRAVAAEQGVALTVDTLDGVWVSADPDRIRQVLGNLLSNAIRYTDAEGHVLVKVRAEVGEAVLTVRDTGMGMTPHDQARVFDRFWRADPARQRATGGSGLGLTIAHRIVSDHGGRIEVDSMPAKGTTFTVRLPLVRNWWADAIGPAAPSAAGPDPR
ncbi:sensor histidine kinase [Jidongwangia harbinensis]|uniref:sensor histidine kinase n=1 Tax=Jidongwangia harbinensis TaxID=2878561 RepID=UPI001CDA0371|nr:ATP-binding protein [Jidongwangia harbinensis]MCA2213112.1 HAMP domain-containing protein [Jidongwangia harbinensis]